MNEPVRNVDVYRTSKDYKKLYQRMQKTSLVCIVDYDTHGGSRDVARTIWYNDMASVSARGVCYVSAIDEKQFVEQCEKTNLKWILF